MSTQHSKAAAAFLADADKATWHDATFWALRDKRDGMARGLGEWERLREAADAIKRHTLSHLDTYLERFAERFGEIVGTEYVVYPGPLRREGRRLLVPFYAAHCL